jgi:hypothetical protein
MTTHETPADPAVLREEIARTRSDLGRTVEALAAKTDVGARARDAAGHAADQAREVAGHAADQAREVAHTVKAKAGDAMSVAGEHVRSGADSVHETVIDMPPATRSLPLTALALAGAAVAGIVLLIRRRRS